MGSYTDLTINGYPIVASKSAVISEVMTVFQESDKCVSTQMLSDRNEMTLGKTSPEEDHEEESIKYSCEVSKVIDRLNIMGFTLERAQEEFEKNRLLEVEKYTSWMDEGEDSWCSEYLDYYINLTIESYSVALQAIINQRIRPHQYNPPDKEFNPFQENIFDDDFDYVLGFLAYDLRLLIRFACELVPANSFVEQDITELVNAGYYDRTEPVCTNSITALTSGHPENSTRIILTEGSSDIGILQDALELLYPHLVNYYTFLDFKSFRARGGAASLVNTVKAFSAAGISNRIIAIFDNDSAAFDARRALASVNLPSNIAVCNYPDLEYLEYYPTLGPNGHARLDVNRLAASVELYLGRDILLTDGNFPVQWKGYVESLQKYQGEVMHKTKIQELFREKVKRCKYSKAEFDKCDWSGLDAILKVIFNAFD